MFLVNLAHLVHMHKKAFSTTQNMQMLASISTEIVV